MGDFEIAERQFYAEIKEVRPGIALNSDARTIEVILTSSEWDVVKAVGGKVFFGFERSTDNGKTWSLLVGLTVEIGYRNKKGLMPNLKYQAESKLKGVLVRPFVKSDADLKIGFTGTWQ